jgi:benzylsuccinate CoA-transferase BbsF subunit
MPVYPLTNIRVVDFGWVLAGAIPGQILADLGAQVIKVETRKRLDFMRQGRPLIGDKPDPEQNPTFHNVNRGKLSFAVDMEHPKGAELLLRLVRISDVVIENFSVGVLKKFGVDYVHLQEIKPDIIMISMSSAGQYGSFAGMRSYASTINAMSGLDSTVGYEGERVLGIQQPYSDLNASLHAAFAVLSALWYRNRTGQGQYIDLSQWETSISVAGEIMMHYIMNQKVVGTVGNADLMMAPHGNYPCKGEDEWVSIAVNTEEEWRSFCQAIGNPPWTRDSQFADRYNRIRNWKVLDKYVSEWTKQYSPYEVTEQLQRHRVAAAPVLNVEKRFYDPHLKERGDYIEIEHPILGAEWVYGPFWKSSADMGGIRQRAPLLGEHTAYILKELLGMGDKEIQALLEEHVLE